MMAGNVELPVVGEQADRVAAAEGWSRPLQESVRPLDDDLIGIGEPARRRERLACVAHGHAEAEAARHAGERRRGIDGAEHEQAWWWCERLHEHGDAVIRGLPGRAVVTHDGRGRVQHLVAVLAHHDVEARRAERAGDLSRRVDQELGADDDVLDLTRDDGGKCDGSLGADAFDELVERRRSAPQPYQSNGSMKIWTEPPQGRPTANASSSL